MDNLLHFIALHIIKPGPTPLRHVDDDAFCGLAIWYITLQVDTPPPPLLHLACDVLTTINVVHDNLQYIPNDYFQHSEPYV